MEVAEFGVTINNLQPGVHDTDRIKSLDAHIAKRQASLFQRPNKSDVTQSQ